MQRPGGSASSSEASPAAGTLHTSKRDRGAAVAGRAASPGGGRRSTQPILGDGRGVAQEARADGGEVAVELENHA